MRIFTSKEATEAIAIVLWGMRLDRDVRAIAVDIEDGLDQSGYMLVAKPDA